MINLMAINVTVIVLMSWPFGIGLHLCICLSLLFGLRERVVHLNQVLKPRDLLRCYIFGFELLQSLKVRHWLLCITSYNKNSRINIFLIKDATGEACIPQHYSQNLKTKYCKILKYWLWGLFSKEKRQSIRSNILGAEGRNNSTVHWVESLTNGYLENVGISC